jgi:8-oxo-dGTP pyrophosphatase MutT (NUDIX family)
MTGPRHVVEGGVIVRHHRADGTFFLVIRRQDDWSLPKGHPEPDDAGLLATAARELEEEAGVRCTVDGPAGVFTYATGDERRSVHFFTGVYDGSVSTDKELDGVTQTLWLRREAAAQQLTYDDLREFFLHVTAPRPVGVGASWWQRHNVRLDRLASAIDVFGVEVDVLRERSRDGPVAAMGRSAAVDRLVELAKDCVASRRVDAGWEALHAARRLCLSELTADELSSRSRALRAEADEKLTKWRKGAASELLGSDSPRASDLEEGARLLDENSMNVYLKLRLSRTALPIAAALLGAILVTLGFAVRRGWFDALGEPEVFVLTDFGLFSGAAVLGAFGAMLSLALDRDGASLANRRIYEVAGAHVAVPVARLSIGAASGVLVVAAVQSSLADVGQSWAILAAIPAGFSERLVRRSVESLDISASGARSTPGNAPGQGV